MTTNENTSGTSRINLSVPSALKARMDAEPDINWSRLASAAFERELDDRDVARRLASTDDREQRGRTAGTRWARKRATRKQLRGVADMVASDGWGRFFDDEGWSLNVLRNIDDGAWSDFDDCRAFWKEWTDDADLTDEFAIAFFEAAADVFDRVHSKV